MTQKIINKDDIDGLDKTSDFVNDGSDGISTYVEMDELELIEGANLILGNIANLFPTIANMAIVLGIPTGNILSYDIFNNDAYLKVDATLNLGNSKLKDTTLNRIVSTDGYLKVINYHWAENCPIGTNIHVPFLTNVISLGLQNTGVTLDYLPYENMVGGFIGLNGGSFYEFPAFKGTVGNVLGQATDPLGWDVSFPNATTLVAGSFRSSSTGSYIRLPKVIQNLDFDPGGTSVHLEAFAYSNAGTTLELHGKMETIDGGAECADVLKAKARGTTVIYLSDTTSQFVNDGENGIDPYISNVVEDVTPQLGGELDINGHSIIGDAQTATGDGTTTIDWKLGNMFNFKFGAFNEVFTFTAPTKAGTFILKLVQDSVGSRTVTFPANVKWIGGAPSALTTTPDTGTDILTIYFDGTDYFIVESLNFS